MAAYALWNNKGGVGKSFLCFVAATEYARRNPNTDVYVIDLCPQANVSEMLLGSYDTRVKVLQRKLASDPRATIAGYLEARLSSPFLMIDNIAPYITQPRTTNGNIPSNVRLIAGDNLLEVIAEAIRQTSQLSIPTNAWRQVTGWVSDLVAALRVESGVRDAVFFIDCNPSFAIYTQLALAASNFIVVPFTSDDSSRRAIQNVVALLFGIGDDHTATYARISFARRAKDEGLIIPVIHTFVSNRVTLYEGVASKAFAAASKTIKATMDQLHRDHRSIFASPRDKPSGSFVEVPDYHTASIVSSMMGIPLHRLKAGPKMLAGERVQINQGPLDRYRDALDAFVDRL
jgi:cellulose biosynthesis protein BcsQ